MEKPFLILQLRANDKASDNEFEAFLKFGHLQREEVRRIRMESQSFPEIDLNHYAGMIIGGGESNVSDEDSVKPLVQKAFEKKLVRLLEEVFERDFPFLGACYGLGILGKYLGVKVSKEKFGEQAGAETIKLTADGETDPLLKGVPREFRAFLGHKESWQEIPDQSVLLASSAKCPVHMIRVKHNIYATQFHPELDIDGVLLRIKTYNNAGYFLPEEAEELIEKVKKENIIYPMRILKNFVDRYKQK
ncbi:MAG: glutamine amidotransferase [Saprospiraceae bacterium]|nr:glutamine amidotransferase [Saprospiraceae bacterium]MCB9324787.1 glutamine amidotransferase [Lewinellaceae bacterium]